MKHSLLLFLLLSSFTFDAFGDESDHLPFSKRAWLKQSAKAVMEDIVPTEPLSDATVRVSGQTGQAIWGKLFGDDQIGALVAVKSKRDPANDDAILCLLLWSNGWNFAEIVGTVSIAQMYGAWSPFAAGNWNWDLKQRAAGEPYYVVSGMDVNRLDNQEHPSWLCDRKTHSLIPTGWPKDAIPSISGGTISFRRNGYGFEIDKFDGKVGKNLAIFADEVLNVTMPEPATGKRMIWRIAYSAARPEVGHDRRSICYCPADEPTAPFHEDAVIDLQWADGASGDSINFLLWRLTGIERNAELGIWEEEMLEENEGGKLLTGKPVRVVVTGIPEAVKAFSWPLNPPTPVPEGK